LLSACFVDMFCRHRLGARVEARFHAAGSEAAVLAVSQDMHLFFRNIVVYNGAASEFGKLSNKVEKCFEDHWAASGLAGGPSVRDATVSCVKARWLLRLQRSLSRC
jgi:hypothetical protein